jgi:hypothetical protein
MPPSVAKNKLRRFGSEDEFRKYYISAEARKLIKSGLSVDETRSKLNAPPDLAGVSLEILIKLKLVKLTSRKGKKEAQEAIERKRYLNSKEFADKKRAIESRRENMTYRDWVEECTGIGRERGGTCIRPDIYLTWNDKACDGCQCYEFCMCYNKRLSHEKRKKRR